MRVFCGFAAAVLAGPLAAQPLPREVIEELERPVAPRTGVACPDPGAYSLARPDPPGTPTVVGVALFFLDVAQLSDLEQTLDADISLVLRWRDPRLMLLPWGACLAALAGPIEIWWLGPVLLGYWQLLIATDSVRLYQHAAPAVCIAAALAIPPELVVPVLVAHWCNPWAGNGI